jgi:hypothetical protein
VHLHVRASVIAHRLDGLAATADDTADVRGRHKYPVLHLHDALRSTPSRQCRYLNDCRLKDASATLERQ